MVLGAPSVVGIGLDFMKVLLAGFKDRSWSCWDFSWWVGGVCVLL